MGFPYSGPLRAFRIADRRHPLFDGTGSYLHGSRWSSPGRRVINAAETFAGAMLEILVHSNLGRVPQTHAWIAIEMPPAVSREEVPADEISGWDAPDLITSRKYGDRWYRERRTAVLLVPSLVTHGVERNVLLNQDHPDFPLVTASPARDVNWDDRLFRR